jgi:hypothetical protein
VCVYWFFLVVVVLLLLLLLYYVRRTHLLPPTTIIYPTTSLSKYHDILLAHTTHQAPRTITHTHTHTQKRDQESFLLFVFPDLDCTLPKEIIFDLSELEPERSNRFTISTTFASIAFFPKNGAFHIA